MSRNSKPLETSPKLARTVSPAEVARFLGCGLWQVNQLRQLGDKFGPKLHPWRGGLARSFKAGYKSRRFLLSSVDAHIEHLAKLATDPAYVVQQLERARALGELEAGELLERRLHQLTGYAAEVSA